MDAVSAEYVSVTPCGPEVPVIVLWTTARVWPATNRSVTAEERVNVAPASALTPNSRVPPVRLALPVQESVLNKSKSEMKTYQCTNTFNLSYITYFDVYFGVDLKLHNNLLHGKKKL